MPRPRNRRTCLAPLALGLACLTGPARADDLAKDLPRIPATEPDAARKTLKVQPGFRVQVAATEPLVTDPVCAAYDADGRLYVVEMRGYPYPENSPSGGVRRLEDLDGDGRFDRSTVFVDDLSWPTSVLPYDGGVFIAVAPDILYAKDTDGDGKADLKKVVFTGFGTKNVQQLVNGLCWGLDGWVYGATAGNGGSITNPARPGEKPVVLSGQDFRFKPDGSAFETLSGGGQFGNVFDDWGHRFVCNNRWHARQIALPSRYLARNPALAVLSVIADIAADGNEASVYRISPPEPWRVVRSRQYEEKMKADPVFARRLPNAERHAAGFFSSASGITVYRGSAFPPEYRGNAFVCDVAGNLVHRKTLSPNGSVFRADRAEPGRKAEFFASTDIWFRPVNMANTPDGTLLVLDMYRETIEHPLSIPEDIKSHLDLTSGKDRGRLYEVVPDGFDANRRRKPALSRETTAALVAHLASPDAWWRETAQRLLLERRDPAAVPLLKDVAKTRPTPQARAHALWTLEALGSLDDDLVLAAFDDPEPGVREQAAKLAEDRSPARNHNPQVHQHLIALAADPHPMVRFQAALSLGFVNDPAKVPALLKIAVADQADPWARTAVLSAVGDDAPAFLAGLLQHRDAGKSAIGRVWLEESAALVAARKQGGEVTGVIERLSAAGTDPGVATATLIGLKRGLQRAGTGADALRGSGLTKLEPLFARAADVAAADGSTSDRLDAIRLLGLAAPEKVLSVTAELLDARQPIEVQLESLRALGDCPDRGVATAVTSHWRSLSPSARREAAEVLMARPERVVALLDAVESKTIAPADLDPDRRRQLSAHKDVKIRERAAKLFGRDAKSPRDQVIANFLKAAALAGDRVRGRTVFQKTCATCHRADGVGVEVGPNLATVTGRGPEDLLVQILDPNREVAPNFVNYNVATTDGRVVSGLIAEETGASVVLKRAEGVTEVVPRARIESISATGLSVMPEGLETGLSPQDLADVISFIRGIQAQSQSKGVNAAP